jgi:hypothetical protein
MDMFGTPKAVSAKVASTLHTHGHTRALDKLHRGARTYTLQPMGSGAAEAPDHLPCKLSLIFDKSDRSVPTQLHLDRRPVPSRFWSYDDHTGILSWEFHDGTNEQSGRMTVLNGGASMIGHAFDGANDFGVKAVLQPVTYLCEVATNTGATVTGTAPALQLSWNTSDPRWNAATWIPGALLFTYQIVGQVIVGQETYNIVSSFQDAQTETPWKPDQDTMECLLDANLYFTFALNGGLNPGTDSRSGLPAPANTIPTVFPYLMRFQLQNESNDLVGAMLTVSDSQAGTVLGVRGVFQNPNIVGLYAATNGAGETRPFSVYDGKLHIADVPVDSSVIRGRTLHFSGLSGEQQAASGLPAEGELKFSTNGRHVSHADTAMRGSRVKPEQATQLFLETPEAKQPAIAALHSATSLVAAGSGLSLTTLANMTQFTFQNSVWSDAVQTATMSDFNDILVYYMPSDLRTTYYSAAPSNLPTWLQQIAAMGDNPSQWYQSLSVGFLTNVMHSWNETGANQLNGVRAQAWLKTQTALSSVFQVQSAAIYSQEWTNQLQNSTLPQYLADQQQNKGSYASLITQDASAWIASLPGMIVDQATIDDMTKLITQLSVYASQGGYYWAYTFFRYITRPAALATIQAVSLGQATDLDGSAFMRLVQTNVALLSLLDPSNQFSQQYVQIIQIFQLSNMLPTLLDYSGNPSDYVFAVQQVLAQIAAQYQSSSDPTVAQAVAAAQQIIAQGNLNNIIMAMQAAVAGTAGIYSWEQIAGKMQNAALKFVSSIGANLLCLAMSGVGMLSLVYGTMSWGSLSVAQQLQVATAGASFAIQALSTMVKNGVAIGAIWDTGETVWSNLTSIFKSTIGGKLMTEAQGRLQTGFSSWLVGSTEAEVPSEMFGLLFSEEAEAESSLVTKVFGRNLSEFLATRLAAVVSVINLVVSIIMAIHSSGLEAAGNWLIVSSAALDVIATVGAWALGAAGITEIGGFAVASICSVLSFLAILAAVAGVIILLYLAFRPQKNPVQIFGTDYAQPHGFYMPHGWEIDYFNGYVQSGEDTRIGLSFTIPGQSSLLKLNADGTTATGSVDYNYDTVFFPVTNGLGQTTLTGVAIDGKGNLSSLLLTDMGNGTAQFTPGPAPGVTTPNTQLWTMVLQSDPSMDGDFPASGPFQVTSVSASKVLTWSGSALTLSASGGNWTITQSAMAIAGVSMANIQLYTFSSGNSQHPVATQKGSMPQTWTINPALPSFMQFDTTTGAVSQVDGQSPPVYPATSFTVAGKNQSTPTPAPAQFTLTVSQFTS